VPRSGSFTLWRFAEEFEPDVACAKEKRDGKR